MKLPDYLSCIEVKELLLKMGIHKIPELNPIIFERSTSKVKTIEVVNPQVAFADRLKFEAVTLDQVMVSIGQDGIIEVNGLKACAYIKKQKQGIDRYNKTSTYKYHLCNCHTIEQMISSGRKDRYVSTTRCDGFFPVIDQSTYPARQVEIRLELCKNCEVILKNKRMFPFPYSLSAFFKKFQPEIPASIKKTEQVIVKEPYAPNHDEIAQRYKEQANYTCQICGVDGVSKRNCIHLHHKDGDGQNNNSSNLSILCTDCHSRQLYHGHMLNNPDFIKQIDEIKILRTAQGILQIT